MSRSRALGPNLKKLIIHKMSVDAVPVGGGIGNAIDFLLAPGGIGAGWKRAAEWCDSAIAKIRQAPEPNPWKESSEEVIAAELMRRIDERKGRSHG